MTDDVQKLRETLATLHTEVDAAGTRDPDVRALLIAAVHQIATRLDAHESGQQAPASGQPAPGEAQDLAEVARHFEVEHPTVAATLRGILESLSRMGI
jgi:hypothetical protein